MHVTDGTLADNRTLSLSVISYNMHGFNQGSHSVRDLALSSEPDVFLVQEHWLTPANLSKFDDNFPSYQCFGSSAMVSCVETVFCTVDLLVVLRYSLEIICVTSVNLFARMNGL